MLLLLLRDHVDNKYGETRRCQSVMGLFDSPETLKNAQVQFLREAAALGIPPSVAGSMHEKHVVEEAVQSRVEQDVSVQVVMHRCSNVISTISLNTTALNPQTDCSSCDRGLASSAVCFTVNSWRWSWPIETVRGRPQHPFLRWVESHLDCLTYAREDALSEASLPSQDVAANVLDWRVYAPWLAASSSRLHRLQGVLQELLHQRPEASEADLLRDCKKAFCDTPEDGAKLDAFFAPATLHHAQ